MKCWVLLIVILLLLFVGSVLAAYLTWKVNDKYPDNKRASISFIIWTLLFTLACALACISNHTNFK